MNLQRLDGLITFPSFHTAVAVLMVHAARGTSCFWLAIVVNALMILSTFTEGGHYLVDVVAGAAIALLAIGVVSAARSSRSPDGDRT
jgi:membrane-associated phospholipid phosphatase